MGTEPRVGKPYLWATAIAGLVSGEKSCQWAAWFKAHHTYDKRPDENETSLVRWNAEHSEMVRSRADVLRETYAAVRVEDQNKFTYRGKVATVGAKPDLVALAPGVLHIEDCKTGRERNSDIVQVAIYLMLATGADERLVDRRPSGAVVYRDRIRPIGTEEAASLQPLIVTHIKRASSSDEPRRVPSAAECRFCDIACCPDRAIEVAQELEPDVPVLDGALF